MLSSTIQEFFKENKVVCWAFHNNLQSACLTKKKFLGFSLFLSRYKGQQHLTSMED